MCPTVSSSSDRETKLLKAIKMLGQVKAQTPKDAVVEEQDDRAALAQLYVRLLENEVEKQDFSDEDRAEIESLLSRMRQKFAALGRRIKGGFRKVKNFFRRKG